MKCALNHSLWWRQFERWRNAAEMKLSFYYWNWDEEHPVARIQYDGVHELNFYNFKLLCKPVKYLVESKGRSFVSGLFSANQWSLFSYNRLIIDTGNTTLDKKAPRALNEIYINILLIMVVKNILFLNTEIGMQNVNWYVMKYWNVAF